MAPIARPRADSSDAGNPSPATVPAAAAEPSRLPTAQPSPGDAVTAQVAAPTLQPAASPGSAQGPAETPVSGTSTEIARPAGRSASETQHAAYQRVFALWGQPMDDSDIPCNVATRVGLQCLRDTGGWSALLRTDRPAVLELWGADAQPFYGAATAIGPDSVDIDIDGSVERVARDTLEQHWYGAFVVLWRMPPDYRGRLQVGDSGPTAAWLRRQLAAVQATKLESEHPDVFDQQLRDALVRFQRSAGVVPDGVAGPATWIALDSARGSGDPRIVGPH
jgi:general secretion pathway protein A